MSTDQTYNESQLVQQLSQGDEAALKALYDTYYLRLVYFSDNIIQNTQQAEDIVITAFTRYWERRDKFESLPQIVSFLYTTIRNDCYKYFRQSDTQHRSNTQDPVSTDDEDFVESLIVLTEILDYIHQQIETLSPAYRDVIRLLFLEEMSVSETAGRLGITIENVRKRKERALEQLRTRILIDRIRPLSLLVTLIGMYIKK